jgi:fatty acid desaturase
MIKDRFLNWVAILSCIGFTAGMLLKGLPYWWIGALIAFLLIGFNYEEEDEEDKYWPDDWEDYKSQYEPPDEYNVPDEKN